MVMKYILFSAGETVVKIGAMKLVEHFAGKNQIQDLEKEKLEAMRAATAQQLQALALLQQQPFAVPTGPVGIPAPVAVSVATEASKPCPSCFVPGSLVVGHGWMKPIEEVAFANSVLTAKGRYQRALRTFEHEYSGDLVVIRAAYTGEPLKLTPEHPVLIARRLDRQHATARKYTAKKPYLLWVPAREVRQTDALVFAFPTKTHKGTWKRSISARVILSKQVPLVEKEGFLYKDSTHWSHGVAAQIPYSLDLFRLVGRFLAEGDAGLAKRGGYVAFSWGPKEEYLAQDTAERFERVFGLRLRLRRTRTSIRLVAESELLSRLFIHLFGGTSINHRLDDAFMFAPLEMQRELVLGYWEGDGHYTTAHKQDLAMSSTSSPAFASQLRILLFRLGVLHNLKVLHPNGKGHNIEGRIVYQKTPAFRFQIQGNSLRRLKGEPDQKTSWRNHEMGAIINGRAILPVRKITREKYDGPVYNFSVQKDETYTMLAGAVHNCTLYEETSLARSYSETIVRHCGEGEVIPRGYGGTVLQVREHLERAAMAAEALREKPQFAQPGQMIAQGLRGLIKGLEGQGVTCAQVRQVLPSLQEAEGVADRIAVLWWQKPEGSGSSQAPQGRT